MSELLKFSRGGQWELLEKSNGECPCCGKKDCNCKPNCMLKNENCSEMASQATNIVKDEDMKKEHIGFKNLQHKLEREGHSEESAGNIAAAIGRKKYGAHKMNTMAHKSEETQEMLKFSPGSQWSISEKRKDQMPDTTKEKGKEGGSTTKKGKQVTHTETTNEKANAGNRSIG